MDDHRKNYRAWDAEQNGHGASLTARGVARR